MPESKLARTSVLSPTDINYLAYPVIFNNPQGTYKWNGSQIVISGAELTAFDRKTLLALEYLYFTKMNNDYSAKNFTFALSDLCSILNVSITNYEHVYDSLIRLSKCTLEMSVTLRRPDCVSLDDWCAERGFSGAQVSTIRDSALINIRGVYRLLGNVTLISGLDNDGFAPSGSRCIVRAEFSDWQVNNFRSKYYRLVDRSLYTSCRSALVIALLDYIYFNRDYRSSSGAYKSRATLKVSYDDMCLMSGFKAYKSDKTGKYDIKLIRRQLAPLKALVDLGVLTGWNLTPASSSYDPPAINLLLGDRPTTTKRSLDARSSALYNKFIAYGIPSPQAYQLLNKHPQEYLEDKIANYEYVAQHHSYVFKDHAPSKYLYLSIIQDWTHPDYIDARKRLAQHEELVKRGEYFKKMREEDKLVQGGENAPRVDSLPEEEKARLVENALKENPKLGAFAPQGLIAQYALALEVDSDPKP